MVGCIKERRDKDARYCDDVTEKGYSIDDVRHWDIIAPGEREETNMRLADRERRYQGVHKVVQTCAHERGATVPTPLTSTLLPSQWL